MNVAEMERRFFELKGKYDVGAVGEAEFKTEIEKLRFQDSQNRWWMIGAQSGRWYVFDGERWIPGKPPEEPSDVSGAQPEVRTPLAPTPSPVPTPPPPTRTTPYASMTQTGRAPRVVPTSPR